MQRGWTYRNVTARLWLTLAGGALVLLAGGGCASDGNSSSRDRADSGVSAPDPKEELVRSCRDRGEERVSLPLVVNSEGVAVCAGPGTYCPVETQCSAALSEGSAGVPTIVAEAGTKLTVSFGERVRSVKFGIGCGLIQVNPQGARDVVSIRMPASQPSGSRCGGTVSARYSDGGGVLGTFEIAIIAT